MLEGDIRNDGIWKSRQILVVHFSMFIWVEVWIKQYIQPAEGAIPNEISRQIKSLG